MSRLPPRPKVRFDAIVHALTMAVVVFRHQQLVYANAAAEQLQDRMRRKHRSELTVLLRDHLESLREKHEADVVELVLPGWRNRDIAATLGTSAATVQKHLTHIFDKVGVDTRTQLVSRIA